MDGSQRRAWNALGIGPRWALRETVAGGAVAGAASTSGPPAVDIVTAAIAATGGSEQTTPSAMDWPALRAAVAGCTRCGLCRGRTRTVFGVGGTRASWMIVGEAPGAEEDARGEPFVGKAGQLLDAMLASVGLARGEDVFIANVLKCRPPANRDPQPQEVAACAPYLQRQITLVAPKLILVMGRFAAQTLLGTEASIASLRGRVHAWRSADGATIPAVVSYHPAYLLRNLTEKSKAWTDLCLARSLRSRLEAGEDVLG